MNDNLKMVGLVIGGSVVGSAITSLIMMRANVETFEMIEENKKLCDEVKENIRKHNETMKNAEDSIKNNLGELKETISCLDETFKVTNEAFRNVAKQCETLNADVKSVYKVKADEVSKYLSDIIKQEGIDVVESVKKTLRQMEKETVTKKSRKTKTEQA